ETPDFVLDVGKAGEDQNGRLHLGDALRPENLEARHIRQVQVEQDDVVIVPLAEIDTLLAEVGGIDLEGLRLEHQLNGLSGTAVVLNSQNAHADLLPPPTFITESMFNKGLTLFPNEKHERFAFHRHVSGAVTVSSLAIKHVAFGLDSVPALHTVLSE